MKQKLFIAAILFAVAAFGTFSFQSENTVKAQDLAVQRCVVNDSSGTPLNIRSTPNGKIVGKLKKGTHVAFDTESGDGQDRSWANVWLDTNAKKKGKRLGWVLREFLECE